MKGGAVALWSFLLAVGLLSAYLTWTRKSDSRAGGDVVVLDIEPDDVSALRLETGRRTLELVRTEDEWWVSVVDRPGAQEAEPGSGAGESDGAEASAALESGAAEKPPGSTSLEFRANESARALVARFAPLVAVRDLGAPSRERLGEFGLDSPDKTLTVAHEGGEESFDVGGHPYGSPHVYLRRRGDGRVYLARAGPLSDLEDAEARLLDRRLHGFALSDVDRAVVSAGGRRRELVRRAGDDAVSFWADAATPEERNELYETWLRKAHQLYVSELLAHQTAPASSTPVVTIEYYQGATKRGHMSLRSEPAGEGAAERFRARSEHTLRWVRVTYAEGDAVARDVDNVLSP